MSLTPYEIQRRKEDRIKIETLEEEVRRLNPDVDTVATLALMFRLPRMPARILAALSDGTAHSAQGLAGTLCRADSTGRSINTQICYIRKAIAPIKVTTLWGIGYVIHGEDLAAIREVIAKGRELIGEFRGEHAA